MFGKMRLSFTALAVGSLLFGASGLQAAAADGGQAATAAETTRIVVLGDSVSVGYEPGVKAAADAYGYADRLLEQALLHGRAEESNYALLGLTSEGLVHLLQGAQAGKALKLADLQDFGDSVDPRISEQAAGVASQAPELAASLKVANVVAITIGGNDFLGGMRALAESGDIAALAQFKQNFDNELNNYADHVKEAVQMIHELAPNATIKLADQYLPLPKQYNADLYDGLLGLTDDLADRLDDLAAEVDGDGAGDADGAGGSDSGGANLEIVHVRDLFVGKELGLTHLFDAQDVHPNQTGYAAIAKRFSEAIWGGYTALEAAPKGTAAQPLAPAIYIDGKLQATQNAPKLKSGTTFLALRDVAAATKADLAWDAKTKTATFRKNGSEVKLTIGAKTMSVNGKPQTLAQPAYLAAGVTYVPLAAIAGGLQYQVVYRAKLHTAFIHS